VDAKMINPFILATVKVLETMAFIQSKAGKVYLKKDSIARGDISGVIGITGEQNGTISVTFKKKCILKIVSNMLGEKIETINRDVQDAVGELTNMISGQARVGLEEMGKIFHAAIPTVITGENHTIISISSGPKFAIPFTTEDGDFTIEVCFD